MAQELPWFRFSPQEWQNGDITLENYELQGLFINICSYYWIKDCSITLALLERRFNNANGQLKQLISAGIIEHDIDTDFVRINFLDLQFDELSSLRKVRQEAGRKGGLSKTQAELKQSSSYKKRIEEKRIEDKREEKSVSTPAQKIEFCKDHYRSLWKEAEPKHRDAITKIIDMMIEEQLTHVMCKAEHPTYKDITKWLKDFDLDKILNTIRAMENKPRDLAKTKTMRLTLNNWINR